MSEVRKNKMSEVDKKVLQQMELKRKKILTHISDLPQSKKQMVIKNLDELIIMAMDPLWGGKKTLSSLQNDTM